MKKEVVNIYKETIEALKKQNLTEKDILWVIDTHTGIKTKWVDIKEVFKKFYYVQGFDLSYFSQDILLITEKGFFWRKEDDDEFESWEFVTYTGMENYVEFMIDLGTSCDENGDL